MSLANLSENAFGFQSIRRFCLNLEFGLTEKPFYMGKELDKNDLGLCTIKVKCF